MNSEQFAKSVKFSRTEPKDRPVIDDIVGTGRKFLDDIQASIKGVGVFDSMGVSPNTSYLLSGVHGTGKTHSIKALNNTYNKEAVGVDLWDLYSNICDDNDKKPEDQQEDLKALKRQTNRIYSQFFKLNLLEYRIGEHGTAFINVGAKILQNFFNVGKKLVEQTGKPTVLVFDEADQIMGARGGNTSHKEDDKLLSTLMKNLQDVQDIPLLFTVFLTNFPKAMDEASIRAGRIDKRYHFENPDFDARVELIKSIIQQRNDEAGYMVIRKYDIEELAELTDGFSNADIDQVIKESVRKRAREIIRERSDQLIPAGYVTQVRIKKAIEKHRDKFKLNRKGIGY